MGLLEDLNSGKYNLVLFGIIFIFMFHQYWGASQTKFEPQGKAGASQTKFDIRSTKEPMADVSNDIKEAVKQVYLADVEAIRNLSEVANKLQAGGYTIPGDLTVKGQIISEKKINGLTLSELNNKIDSVNSSLSSSISSTNTNLTNNVSSLQRQINTKISNNAQVTIEIQSQSGRNFSHPRHKLAKRNDGLLFTWDNPNDSTTLYNWKLTAV
jgi:hypothetical protein